MLKVVCTVVFILGSGARQVEHLEGIVLKNSNGPRILVDFGKQVPDSSPEAVWVSENDCLYMQDPEKYYYGNKELEKSFFDELKQSFRSIFK